MCSFCTMQIFKSFDITKVSIKFQLHGQNSDIFSLIQKQPQTMFEVIFLVEMKTRRGQLTMWITSEDQYEVWIAYL